MLCNRSEILESQFGIYRGAQLTISLIFNCELQMYGRNSLWDTVDTQPPSIPGLNCCVVSKEERARVAALQLALLVKHHTVFFCRDGRSCSRSAEDKMKIHIQNVQRWGIPAALTEIKERTEEWQKISCSLLAVGLF